MPVTAAVTAVSAVSGVAQANAVNSAADKAASAEERMFEKGREDLRPFREAGTKALERYESLMADPSQIKSLPGYEFRRKEGQDMVEGSASARGKLFSGETGKALMKYGQDYASNELDKQLAREGQLINTGAQAAATGAQQAGYAGKTLAEIEMNRGKGVADAYGTIASGVEDAVYVSAYKSGGLDRTSVGGSAS